MAPLKTDFLISAHLVNKRLLWLLLLDLTGLETLRRFELLLFIRWPIWHPLFSQALLYWLQIYRAPCRWFRWVATMIYQFYVHLDFDVTTNIREHHSHSNLSRFSRLPSYWTEAVVQFESVLRIKRRMRGASNRFIVAGVLRYSFWWSLMNCICFSCPTARRWAIDVGWPCCSQRCVRIERGRLLCCLICWQYEETVNLYIIRRIKFTRYMSAIPKSRVGDSTSNSEYGIILSSSLCSICPALRTTTAPFHGRFSTWYSVRWLYRLLLHLLTIAAKQREVPPLIRLGYVCALLVSNSSWLTPSTVHR